MFEPKVSVIVTTYYSERTLDCCLRSIKNQSYKNLELIVIDTDSQDLSVSIAKKYTNNVYKNVGPERSAKRNFGVKMSQGDFVLIVDSDMILNSGVVESCVNLISESRIQGVVIPEKSVGIGWIAKLKAFERSFYVGIPWMEAARFFRKCTFQNIGGYDEKNTGSEDYDLPNRIEYQYGHNVITRSSEFIAQDEGKIRFLANLKKKFNYGKGFLDYSKSKENYKKYKLQSSLISRYGIFFKSKKFYRHPVLGVGMIALKTFEFLAIGMGYLYYKYKKNE